MGDLTQESRAEHGSLNRLADQIVAWHQSRVTNGQTEAVHNQAKRIKQVAFALMSFRHHRVHRLL